MTKMGTFLGRREAKLLVFTREDKTEFKPRRMYYKNKYDKIIEGLEKVD